MRELSRFFFGFVAALGFSASVANADLVQTNLVSDIPGALATDPNLKNPWGMSFGAMTPFWVSDQLSGNSTLYNALKPANQIVQTLVVSIPSGGAAPPIGPTGQVFNSTTSDFQIPAPGGGKVKAIFLFATLEGSIQGWNPGSVAGLNASEPVAPPVLGAVFTGLALATAGAPTICTQPMRPAESWFSMGRSRTSHPPPSPESSSIRIRWQALPPSTYSA